MKDWAAFFYKSKQWQRCQAYIIKRDKGLCQDCLSKGRLTPAEEVHHIIPLTPENITDPSITINEENLISLCKKCHKARHGGVELRYEIDSTGKVTIK